MLRVTIFVTNPHYEATRCYVWEYPGERESLISDWERGTLPFVPNHEHADDGLEDAMDEQSLGCNGRHSAWSGVLKYADKDLDDTDIVDGWVIHTGAADRLAELNHYTGGYLDYANLLTGGRATVRET